VTTVVDGGSSGAMTFEGLKQFISLKSSTRVLVRFSLKIMIVLVRFSLKIMIVL
jgi:predicted amidohydrolase